MKGHIQTINISNLLLSVDNPRFESTKDQTEALDIMVSQLGKKLFVLTEDIVEAGINPSELVMVVPDKGQKYKVLEGNRRVAALKLLSHPNILKEKHKSFTKKLERLSEKWEKNKITAIDCAVFESEEEANRWIKLRHTGENNGKGIVPWDTLQIGRFESRMSGKERLGLQAINFLKQFDDKTLNDKLKKVSITNLERLLGDKYTQSILGVKINDGSLESDLLREEVKKGLSKIVDDLVSKQIKVKDIYRKEDRTQYIETNFRKQDVPNENKLAERTWQLGFSGIATDKKKGKRILPKPAERKYLIPPTCILNISETKANNIYHELRHLDIADYKYAVSALLRVFIELSASKFIEKYNLPTHEKGKSKPLSLSAKLNNIEQYMRSNGMAQKSELKGIRVMAIDKDSMLSMDSFNEYIHNRHFSPSLDALTTNWDNMQIFMEKLWSNV